MMRELVRSAVAGLSLALAACGVAACGGGADGPVVPPTVPPPAAPTGPTGIVVGGTYEDPRGWIEYQAGNAPLVLIAPHGGSLTPSELPDRSCSGCVTGNDLGTQELARAVVDAFVRRTGVRPHLVVNRLHRRKFDGNRELPEASGGTAALNAPFAWMQAALDSSTGRVTKSFARGLVIDLHGHGHAIPRLELGYLLSDSDLRQTDAALTASTAMTRTSIARLSNDARGTDRGVSLLRGPNSLGALLTAGGYPSVPSPATPAPLAAEEYFDGGYNTRRNGSVTGGTLDAIQIESHLNGVRDNATSRAAFADVLAAALVTYLDRHYGWRP